MLRQCDVQSTVLHYIVLRRIVFPVGVLWHNSHGTATRHTALHCTALHCTAVRNISIHCHTLHCTTDWLTDVQTEGRRATTAAEATIVMVHVNQSNPIQLKLIPSMRQGWGDMIRCTEMRHPCIMSCPVLPCPLPSCNMRPVTWAAFSALFRTYAASYGIGGITNPTV
jgi:hypothetical protein